jgi:hypothetical protein|tara:strand:- start:2352 stop:2549 length:198 start_codon:yes stop_codon:yes gene_type:complete
MKNLLTKLHSDENGVVSLETILIIAAIAIPVLIFVLKIGWPMIRDDIFNKGMEDLIGGIEDVNGQ